eukprot:jgi/Tetstr1/441197/TSEL_029453.t1
MMGAGIGAGGKVMIDTIRNGVRIPFKGGRALTPFQGGSMEHATPDQLRFMGGELARFLSWGDGFYAVVIAHEDRYYFTGD